MRKILIIILIITAIILYVYNAFILFKGSVSPKKEITPRTEELFDINNIIITVKPVHFDKKGRNPFLSSASKSAIERLPSRPTVNVNIRKDTIMNPPFTINGIIWNSQNPIAMIATPDGWNGIARERQIINNFTIKKINKTFIIVTIKNKDIKITK